MTAAVMIQALTMVTDDKFLCMKNWVATDKVVMRVESVVVVFFSGGTGS